jgi:diguanylate cyclase (GGDEF)-like protein
MTLLSALFRFKTFAVVSAIVVFVSVAGIAVTLKATVDYLLYWDATAAAESWAKYVGENVADIEEIADGAQPSAKSMNFFIRTQQIRNVFGFAITNLYGNVQLVSDGSKISSIRGAIHDETAWHAARSDQPIIAVKEGHPPLRPRFYSEAYLPVVIDGKPRAVVAAYVDLTEQSRHFRNAFVVAAFALCLLSGVGVGIPTLAWHRQFMERRRADQRVHYLARHDGLTGLSNRNQFIERVDAALAAIARGGGGGIAIHLIDLDHFKAINDGFGHDGGDFVLKMVAERLRHVTRPSDEIGRFGGDEFVVMQGNVKEQESIENFALRLISTLTTPIKFHEQEINLSMSIGYALAPADGDSSTRLIKCADLALYQAKADGRNCVRGFLPAMDATLKARIELEKKIRHAVSHDGFELHYQPIFEIVDRRLTGFEALIRMRAEDGTLLPPLLFIPVAEELRLIEKIGTWVVREACRTAASWPDHLTVAVNVSVAQFVAGTVSRTVATALEESGLPANRLELEITESLLLGDNDAIMSELRNLKAMGVAIVMDDFGTGYSSLSYLWRFPFNKIKIDQSFMLGLDRSGRDAETIVKTIIALGRELNMRVTVEGVETAKQASFLDEIKGDQAQGFFFGRPVAGAEVAAIILADFKDGRRKGARPTEEESKLRLIH